MIWFLLGFFYFILVDIFIFTQKWDYLVIALVAGGVITLVILLLKALVRGEKIADHVQAPSLPAGFQQNPAQPSESRQVAGIPVIDKNTVISGQQQSGKNLPMIFFFSEIWIVLMMVFYLVVRK